ncbi:jg322, partial [Pararge aegeria aegeria]
VFSVEWYLAIVQAAEKSQEKSQKLCIPKLPLAEIEPATNSRTTALTDAPGLPLVEIGLL